AQLARRLVLVRATTGPAPLSRAPDGGTASPAESSLASRRSILEVRRDVMHRRRAAGRPGGQGASGGNDPETEVAAAAAAGESVMTRHRSHREPQVDHGSERESRPIVALEGARQKIDGRARTDAW